MVASSRVRCLLDWVGGCLSICDLRLFDATLRGWWSLPCVRGNCISGRIPRIVIQSFDIRRFEQYTAYRTGAAQVTTQWPDPPRGLQETVAAAEWSNVDFYAQDRISNAWPNFNNDPCLPFLPTPCSGESYPVSAIKMSRKQYS